MELNIIRKLYIHFHVQRKKWSDNDGPPYSSSCSPFRLPVANLFQSNRSLSWIILISGIDFLFWTYPNLTARLIWIGYLLCAALSHARTSSPNVNRKAIKLLNMMFLLHKNYKTCKLVKCTSCCFHFLLVIRIAYSNLLDSPGRNSLTVSTMI